MRNENINENINVNAEFDAEPDRNPVAEFDRNDLATVGMMANLQNSKTALFSTIPNDGSRENAVAIYNAVNGEGENLTDHLNEIIEVENIVAFPVKFTDDDGEILETLRLSLVTPSGECYSTVSSGVFSSLEKIIGIVGTAPWTPALKVKAVEIKTRKGYKTVVLKLEG